MYKATSNQELLQEQILDIVDHADEMTRSDLQGVIEVLSWKYELIEETK